MKCLESELVYSSLMFWNCW